MPYHIKSDDIPVFFLVSYQLYNYLFYLAYLQINYDFMYNRSSETYESLGTKDRPNVYDDVENPKDEVEDSNEKKEIFSF